MHREMVMNEETAHAWAMHQYKSIIDSLDGNLEIMGVRDAMQQMLPLYMAAPKLLDTLKALVLNIKEDNGYPYEELIEAEKAIELAYFKGE